MGLHAVAAHAESGWWSADEVAAQVPAFAAMQESLPDRLTADQAEQRRLAGWLGAMEVAIDVIGTEGTAAARNYAQKLRRELGRHAGILEAFTTELVEDTGAEMIRAIRRTAEPKGWTSCDAPPIPGFRRASPAALARACTGVNRSAAVAAELAKDALLSARLATIAARPWPTLRVPTPEAPIPAVGAQGAPWLAVPTDVLPLMVSELKSLDEADREARLDLEARAEREGMASRDDLLALDAQLDARLATARHRLTAPVLSALQEVSEHEAPPFALCPVPLALGGCAGLAVEPDLAHRYVTDKRVVRAVKRAKRLDPESLWR